MAKHNTVGRWGEQIAQEYLIAKGYAIRETNWRSGHNELDIIAMDARRIIFVEVKTRSKDDIDPILAIDRRKISRLIQAAKAYMALYQLKQEMQFDIITICGTPERYTLEHIPDAIMPQLKTY